MINNLLSMFYKAAVNQRNKRFDEKKKAIKRSSVPVLSVGNLSVGGTGKTPFVQMLGTALINMGYKPAVVGRGYKRKTKGEIVVSDGNRILANAAEAGDEMLLLAEALKVPVIAHDEKAEGAKIAPEKFNIDVVRLDDGYQHRQLYRDLDIVLIDRDTVENPHVMPKGRLREPIESLQRADVICLTNQAELTDEFVKNIHENAIYISVKPILGKAYNLVDGRHTSRREFRDIQNGTIAVSGIAKPERFREMIENLHIKISEKLDFPDHHDYTRVDLNKIVENCRMNNANSIVTTEKDAAKLREYKQFFAENDIKCYVFPVSLTIIEGKSPFFRKLKEILNNR
ncbi:MAG: tetraacyldisaccharide 4'-kinase [Candidatus Kapaibacterium sp.]